MLIRRCLNLFHNYINSLNNQLIYRTIANLQKTTQSSLTSGDIDKNSPDTNKNYGKILDKVKTDCEKDSIHDKVFAVVHMASKQFKVARHDVIMLNKTLEAECGERIRFEKVLVAGGRNFTLIGQPLLKREVVAVEGVVVEKTRGEKKIVFKKKRRTTYKKWKGARNDVSVVKITDIKLDLENV